MEIKETCIDYPSHHIYFVSLDIDHKLHNVTFHGIADLQVTDDNLKVFFFSL